MGKNDHSIPHTKATVDNTPIQTRGSVKNLAMNSKHASGGLHKADRSTSICSGDCFELLELRLMKSINYLFSERFQEFNDRMMRMEVQLTDIQKIQTTVDSTQADLNRLTSEVNQLKTELADARCIMDNVCRQNRLTDAIITGVPYCQNEQPQQILAKIADKIDHTLSPYSTAFRPKSSPGVSNKAGKGAPLVVKFSSVAEQRQFLYKYKRFGALTLNSITSFVSDSRINIYESFTPGNSKILRLALTFHRARRIYAASTRNGIVYVRVKNSDAPIEVTSLEALNDIIAVAEADNAVA